MTDGPSPGPTLVTSYGKGPPLSERTSPPNLPQVPYGPRGTPGTREKPWGRTHTLVPRPYLSHESPVFPRLDYRTGVVRKTEPTRVNRRNLGKWCDPYVSPWSGCRPVLLESDSTRVSPSSSYEESPNDHDLSRKHGRRVSVRDFVILDPFDWAVSQTPPKDDGPRVLRRRITAFLYRWEWWVVLSRLSECDDQGREPLLLRRVGGSRDSPFSSHGGRSDVTHTLRLYIHHTPFILCPFIVSVSKNVCHH